MYTYIYIYIHIYIYIMTYTYTHTHVPVHAPPINDAIVSYCCAVDVQWLISYPCVIKDLCT